MPNGPAAPVAPIMVAPSGQPFMERAPWPISQAVEPSETKTFTHIMLKIFVSPLQMLFWGLWAGGAVGAAVTIKLMSSNNIQKCGSSRNMGRAGFPTMMADAAEKDSKAPSRERSLASGLLAASAAFAISTTNPTMTHAAIEPVGVVQQYSANFIADADSDLSDAQKKFLAERNQLKQKFDTDTESTFKDVEEVRDKKSIYTTIVVGLIVVAFVAPMIQFFYYTGGD